MAELPTYRYAEWRETPQLPFRSQHIPSNRYIVGDKYMIYSVESLVRWDVKNKLYMPIKNKSALANIWFIIGLDETTEKSLRKHNLHKNGFPTLEAALHRIKELQT